MLSRDRARACRRRSTVACPHGVATRVVRTACGLDVVGPARRRLADASRRRSVVGPVAFDAWRIEQGIPVQPVDVDDTTIPQEAFLELDAVSFTKGCFLGQELVCRIDSRGHVNRFLRRFTDDRRRLARRAAPRSSSTARSSARSRASRRPTLPTGALGYVRREVEPPADRRAALGRRARDREHRRAVNGQSSRPARLNTWPVVPSVGRVAQVEREPRPRLPAP